MCPFDTLFDCPITTLICNKGILSLILHGLNVKYLIMHYINSANVKRNAKCDYCENNIKSRFILFRHILQTQIISLYHIYFE